MIESNKRNAQGSTGPVDTDKTRFNAVKHGLFSGGGVIEDIDGEDAVLLFEELNESLWNELAPVGFIEGNCVTEMVETQWRLRRLRVWETSRTRYKLGVEKDKWENSEANQNSLEIIFGLSDSDQEIFPTLYRLRESISETETIIKFLHSKRPIIKVPNSEGLIKFIEIKFEVNVKELLGIDGMDENIGKCKTTDYSDTELQKIVDQVCHDMELVPQEFRAGYLEFVQKSRDDCLVKLNHRERIHNKAISQAGILDDAEFEKMVRYETYLTNRFYKLLRELQQFQALRSATD